jgi:formylglycine-generating enzyme required for sulfatase activity
LKQEREKKEREEKERQEQERLERERREKEENERREREAQGEFEVKGVKFKMVYVEGGTFTMGATEEQGNDAYEDEKPEHEVTVSDYYIGETVVTQELWKAVMGENPSYFKGDSLPVETVSWDDVQEFIAELNKETGREFRLPTEAQWEYAARGGKKSKKYKYSGSDIINEVAWYAGEKGGGDKTYPVKGKKANELGLYDMSGNVYEWCNDWFGDYSSDAQKDPKGSEEVYRCVRRGGCWYLSARLCRVSYRDFITPSNRDYGMGFRLVMCP